jgi:hypothetical protein
MYLKLMDAFHRNGWSDDDIKKLCEGDTLTKVRAFIAHPNARDLLIENILTVERCKALGFPNSRNQLRFIHYRGGMHNITTLGALSDLTESQLRCASVGAKGIGLTKAILAQYGLKLAD